MGQEKRGRYQRTDSGKRTIIAAALPPKPKNNAPTTARSPLHGEDEGRETVVLPLVTLPSLPALRVPRRPMHPSDEQDYYPPDFEEPEDEEYLEQYDDEEYGARPEAPPSTGRGLTRRRANTEARPLRQYEKQPTSVGSPKAARRYNRHPHPFEVLFVPGRNLSRRLPPQVRWGVNRAIDQMWIVRRHKTLLAVVALIAVLTTTLVAVSNTTGAWVYINQTAWQALSGEHDPPPPTPPPAPDITSAGHYVAKYGFDWPVNAKSLPSDERARMIFMLPYAYRAAAAYDLRYHNSIEPEMLVWWTHAEGIGARINYSNCANEPANSYFTDIGNCDQSGFWQLGYGNQFSVIYVLKNAFTDMYGNPNNAALVQKVGQWVLNFDRQQGTVPACGGYSCTFPKMTIDQIMSGIDETSGVETPDNWWASVLSRDPAINCYMLAQALSFFNHAATLNWVGCYYYEPCWGYESNSLGDILAAWPSLRQAAHM